MRGCVKNISKVLLVCVPPGFILQGIDFTDTGWVLTNYQQIFSNPQSVSYWFHLWLSNVLGGLWNALFGWGGLLSFKIAAVLIFWLTAFCVLRAYKDFVSGKYLFPALALGMILHFPAKITVIHYNNVSTLFLTMSAVLLFSGVKKKSRFLLFLSGTSCCFAAFARIPNVLGLSFVLVLAYTWIMEKGRRRDLIHDTGVFFLGVLAAAGLVFSVMYALGHLSLYLNAVRDLFFGTKQNLSHYGSNTMEKKFFVDWARALFAACLMLGGSFFAHAVCAKVFYPVSKTVCLVLLAVLTAVLTWGKAWSESMVIVYPMAGFITLTCCMMIAFLGNEYKNQKLLALISVLLIGILSVGSDTGMKVGAYALIFGFPLVLWYWYELPGVMITLTTYEGERLTRQSRISLIPALRKGVMAFVLVLYTAYGVPFTLRNVYRDNSLRWVMTQTPRHPLLAGVFTTPARAAAIHELLDELEGRVKPGDVLLTYESIPLLHFITRTQPYLYNPWPILYLPGEFEKNLEKARVQRPHLPVAVFAKVEMRSGAWPKSGEVNMAEISKINRARLYAFLQESAYKKVWENDVFEILIPPAPFSRK